MSSEIVLMVKNGKQAGMGSGGVDLHVGGISLDGWVGQGPALKFLYFSLVYFTHT